MVVAPVIKERPTNREGEIQMGQEVFILSFTSNSGPSTKTKQNKQTKSETLGVLMKNKDLKEKNVLTN